MANMCATCLLGNYAQVRDNVICLKITHTPDAAGLLPPHTARRSAVTGAGVHWHRDGTASHSTEHVTSQCICLPSDRLGMHFVPKEKVMPGNVELGMLADLLSSRRVVVGCSCGGGHSCVQAATARLAIPARSCTAAAPGA